MRIIVIFIFSLFFSIAVNATNLRGQVVRYNPNTRTYNPLGGVRVDLIIWNGSQWKNLSYAITGQDGI